MSSPIFGQLETSLADYLTDITYRAQFGDERAAATVGRFELPRVVEALKAVLDEHSPDEHGRCPSCRTRRFGRAPAPVPRLPHRPPVPRGHRGGDAGGDHGAHAQAGRFR